MWFILRTCSAVPSVRVFQGPGSLFWPIYRSTIYYKTVGHTANLACFRTRFVVASEDSEKLPKADDIKCKWLAVGWALPHLAMVSSTSVEQQLMVYKFWSPFCGSHCEGELNAACFLNILFLIYYSPELEGPYCSENERHRLFDLYHYLHSRIHSTSRPLRLIYHVAEKETLLAWVRPDNFID